MYGIILLCTILSEAKVNLHRIQELNYGNMVLIPYCLLIFSLCIFSLKTLASSSLLEERCLTMVSDSANRVRSSLMPKFNNLCLKYLSAHHQLTSLFLVILFSRFSSSNLMTKCKRPMF